MHPVPSNRNVILGIALVVCQFLFATEARASLELKLAGVIYGSKQAGGLNQPMGGYFDASRKRIYLADSLNGRLVSFDEKGNFLAQFNAAGKLKIPISMVRDRRGRVIVTDRGLGQVLLIDVKGKKIEPLPLPPDHQPHHLALDSTGTLYVADRLHKGIAVFRPQGEGYLFVSILSAQGMQGVQDVKVKDGRVYALDPIARAIFVFSGERVMQKIPLPFSPFPVSVAPLGRGLIYSLDGHLCEIFLLTEDGKVIGKSGGKGWKEGSFYHPHYLFLNNEGTLFVVDTGNNRLQIFRKR